MKGQMQAAYLSQSGVINPCLTNCMLHTLPCWSHAQVVLLRLENGADYYLQVGGSYCRSSFGTSLSEMQSSSSSTATSLGVPYVLWKLVDAIAATGLADADVRIKLLQIPPTTPISIDISR